MAAMSNNLSSTADMHAGVEPCCVHNMCRTVARLGASVGVCTDAPCRCQCARCPRPCARLHCTLPRTSQCPSSAHTKCTPGSTLGASARTHTRSCSHHGCSSAPVTKLHARVMRRAPQLDPRCSLGASTGSSRRQGGRTGLAELEGEEHVRVQARRGRRGRLQPPPASRPTCAPPASSASCAVRAGASMACPS